MIRNIILTVNDTNSIVISILKIALGTLLIFASNQLVIPIEPIPITLFTVSINLIGLTYSPKLSFLTVLTYILGGISGLPIFSSYGAGTIHFIGHSGGYLAGSLIAVPIMGLIKNKLSNNLTNIFISSCVGHIIIYLLGVSWLSTFIGLIPSIYSGFIIFIPSGILKIAIFSLLFSYLSKKI